MMRTETNVLEMQQRRTRRKRRFRSVLLVALLLIFGYGLFWFLFQSTVFRVAEVATEGNRRTTSEEIIDAARRVFEGSFQARIFGFGNILGWPNGVLEDGLRELPVVRRAEIRKDYGKHLVTIAVNEREPIGIWCARSESGTDATVGEVISLTPCAWFDDEGILFERTFLSEGSLLLTVNDHSQETFMTGSKVLPSEFVENFISIVSLLAETELSIREVRLKDIGLQEIEVATYDGPTLYFSLRFPSGNAGAVIENLLGATEEKELEYIDFRVQNRAYYK
jgi:hypothetical protein